MDFKVHAFVDNQFKEISKPWDVLGKWSVFFFYPADFTFVCPTGVNSTSTELYDDFKAIRREVYSVSCDTLHLYKAWHDTVRRLPKYAIRCLQISYPFKGFKVHIKGKGVVERGTFIVNPEGKIMAYEVVAGNIGRNAEETLRQVEALQFVAEAWRCGLPRTLEKG